MKDRKQKVFTSIVEEHIHSAVPVSSLWLAEEAGLHVSSATIRNDLAALEAEGLLAQPNPAAGRVPTEEGYRYYLTNYFEPKTLPKREMEQVAHAAHELRELAKMLSELSGSAAFVAFTPESTYFTGFSAVANQPEFTDIPLLQHLTEIVDHMHDNMAPLFERTLTADVDVLVGSENPLSQNCSLLYTKLSDGAILGLLGPMRMDYAAHVARLQFAKQHYEKNR